MLHCSPPQSSKPNQELSQEHTPSPPAPPQHLSGEPAMLHSVEFLCSVVTAFARLAHVLCEALMSLCSPTSSPGPAGLPPPRKRVHPVATVVGRTATKELVAAPPAVVGTAECNGNAMRAEERKAARRPARLVIPASCAGTDPFGGAGAGETDVAGDVVVEGEEFWLASRRGVRHAMEDGYGVITDKINGDSKLAFYGVYDGHGGRAAVDFISDRLGKNIVSALAVIESQRSQDQQQLQDDQLEMMAVRTGYLTTDREFLSQGARGGACAATALVKDGELYVANVGDCRAVLSSGGVAIALTTDHSAAGEDERARIESSGGYVSCNNGVWRVQDCLAVSRAFGDADMKQWVICEPEIKRLHLTAGCEFLVIASDGLWVKVSNQEAVDAVKRSNGKSMESCKELLNMARSRGSRDDITVMVVDLQRFVQ